MNHSFLGNWVLECFPVQKEGQSKAWWGRHTCGAGPLQIFTAVGASWKGGGGGLGAPGKGPQWAGTLGRLEVCPQAFPENPRHLVLTGPQQWCQTILKISSYSSSLGRSENISEY